MADIEVDYTPDKGVPVPVHRATVPISELKSGESLLFSIKDRGKVQSLASSLKKSRGKEFTVKRVSDTQCRIWRTK